MKKVKRKNKDAVKFGRAGGLAISKDTDHMSSIGSKGAKARWKGHKKTKK